MKRLLSLLLAVITVSSVCAGFLTDAFAAGFASYAQNLNLNSTHTDWASPSDRYDSNEGKYYDAYKFYAPSNGQYRLCTNFESEEYYYQADFYLYSANDTANELWHSVVYSWTKEFYYQKYNAGLGRYEAYQPFNLNKGTYYVVVRFNEYATEEGYYNSSYNIQIQQVAQKKANTLSASGKTVKLKYKSLKKKKQTIARNKAINVYNPRGTVTYSKVSGNKKISINKSTGKITVKKGLKKGTYKLKVKVNASGNSAYKAGYRTVTVTIKVK